MTGFGTTLTESEDFATEDFSSTACWAGAAITPLKGKANVGDLDLLQEGFEVEMGVASEGA